MLIVIITETDSHIKGIAYTRTVKLQLLYLLETNEESYWSVQSNGRKFLYHSKGLDVISLLVTGKILGALGA